MHRALCRVRALLPLMVATFSNVSALSIGNGWQWLATTGNDWRRYPRCHHLIIAIRHLPRPPTARVRATLRLILSADAPREARLVSKRYVFGHCVAIRGGLYGADKGYSARCTLPRRSTLVNPPITWEAIILPILSPTTSCL